MIHGTTKKGAERTGQASVPVAVSVAVLEGCAGQASGAPPSPPSPPALPAPWLAPFFLWDDGEASVALRLRARLGSPSPLTFCFCHRTWRERWGLG